MKLVFLTMCLFLMAMTNKQRMELLYHTMASPYKVTIYNWYGGIEHHKFTYDGTEFKINYDGSYVDDNDSSRKDQLFIKVAEECYQQFGKLLHTLK